MWFSKMGLKYLAALGFANSANKKKAEETNFQNEPRLVLVTFIALHIHLLHIQYLKNQTLFVNQGFYHAKHLRRKNPYQKS